MHDIKYMETAVLSLTYRERLLDECENLSKEYRKMFLLNFVGRWKNLSKRSKLLDQIETISQYNKWCQDADINEVLA